MNSICFDTETTGLHPNGSDPDEILTISIIGRDGSVLLDERFRPTVKTEWPHASAVNGIYPEDVADLPTIETAIPRLREIFAGADEVIGYNVGFDLGFLSAVGVRPREDARITDTMNLFTWFMGRRYKLVDAADHIGYEWTGRAHGSLADALAGAVDFLQKNKADYVVIADGDIVANIPLDEVIERHEKSGADLTMVCTKKQKDSPFPTYVELNRRKEAVDIRVGDSNDGKRSEEQAFFARRLRHDPPVPHPHAVRLRDP